MAFVKKDPEKVFMKYYGYDDGRNIKKKDMVELFSTLESMPPETAAKMLDQFPYLANTATTMAKQFCELSGETVKRDDALAEFSIEVIRSMAEFLEDEIKKGGYSEKGRIRLSEMLVELAGKVCDLNDKSRRFKLDVLRENRQVILTSMLMVVLVLGVNGKFSAPKRA